jgi:Kef-type K+ transport system membrane component KefB
VVGRLVSWVGLKLGQSPVVGEMVAGVLLGPSLTWYERRAQRNGLLPVPDTPEIVENVVLS